jgi:hypothetical protein
MRDLRDASVNQGRILLPPVIEGELKGPWPNPTICRRRSLAVTRA